MKNVRKLLSLLVLASLLCSHLYAESVYTIKEKQLRELEEIQKTLEEQNKVLKTQVRDLEKSYKKSDRQNTTMAISVGCCSFCIGAAAGAALVLYVTSVSGD